MATYWKSQPKHHCEYCDVWITDNKPSREYHESGKRHKENVAKKISELKKKGVSDAKAAEEFEESMERMERAAIEALKKDIKSNPSLAQQYGLRPKTAEEKAATAAPLPQNSATNETATAPSSIQQNDEKSRPANQKPETSSTTAGENTGSVRAAEVQQIWSAQKSPEGYTYYWNTCTNEVTWIKPEGFVEDTASDSAATDATAEAAQQQSVDEKSSSGSSGSQEDYAEDDDNDDEECRSAKQLRLADIPLPGASTCMPTSATDTTAPTTRATASPLAASKQTAGNRTSDTPQQEDHRTQQKSSVPTTTEKPAQQQTYCPLQGPMMKPNVYGQWETVPQPSDEPEEQIDLQLPKVEKKFQTFAPAPEPKIKFREKTTPAFSKSSLFDKSNPEFKRRKLKAALNIRPRSDD